MSSISRKIYTFIAAGAITMAITVPTMGATTYHYFFEGSSNTIDSSTVAATSNFKSANKKHTVLLHPSKITKAGYVYAVRHKKGLIFWSEEKRYKYNVTTIKNYSDSEDGLDGTYYYNLSNYDENSNCSNADITFDQAYVKETS